MPSPSSNPGMMPPTSRRLTESPVTVPAMTIGKLGGMIGPIVEAEAVTAPENSLPYPRLTMAGIMMVPMLTASETAVPLMPAKTMEAPTLARASPPRIWPTMARQNLMIRSVIPPTFIRLPARMKPGTHRITKLSIPENIRSGMMLSGISENAIYTKEEKPKLKAIGIRSMTQPRKTANRTYTIIMLRLP